MRFWDSSAVVPLLVEQPSSIRVETWLREDSGVALWILTPAELTSAFWRLVREGQLNEGQALAADGRAQEFAASAYSLVDVTPVVDRARRLLRTHPLRAADALQLGASLVWAGDQPQGKILHTLDQQLASAARREGFSVP